MSTASKRKLKLEFAGEIRRTTVQDKSFSYEDLESLVVGTFFVGKYPEKGIEVRYRDDDGDAVRVLSDEELCEAFRVAGSMNKVLKLVITLPAPVGKVPEPSAPPESGPASPGPSSEPTSEPETKAWCRRSGRRRSRERKSQHDTLLADVRNFFSDAKMTAALRSAVPDFVQRLLQGDRIRTAFDATLQNEPTLARHPLVRRLAPSARTLMALTPSYSGAVALDLFLEMEELASRDGMMTKGFQGVIWILKRLARAARRSAKRHAPEIHHGVTCDACGQYPLEGRRWKRLHENYDLCDSDYAKLNQEEKKLYKLVEPHSWAPPRPTNAPPAWGRPLPGPPGGVNPYPHLPRGGWRGWMPPPHHRHGRGRW